MTISPPVIRVLVVDDSVVMRRLVASIIDSEADMVTVGTASNGKAALDQIDALVPDVVTLDLEMPVMDGLATLRELRRRRTRVPVIMFSTLTERGADATLDALACGAADYVAKPSGSGGFAQSQERVRGALLPRIRALVGKARSPRPAPARRAVRPSEGERLPLVPVQGARAGVVVIGCSTGGPKALTSLLPALRADLGVPVLVVQHMPPLFTGILARRLDEVAGLTVVEAQHGTVLEANRVYVAPGDQHLVVESEGGVVRAVLNQQPPVHSCRPSVDPLFASAARALRIPVARSRADRHGQRRPGRLPRHQGGRRPGPRAGRAHVGRLGMPGAVVGAGLADDVVDLAALADVIASAVRSGRRGLRASS